MALAPVKHRYDAFCEDAEELLERAGFARPEQDPVIIGRAFYEVCDKLATIHFPDDRELGTGPRGLIYNMYTAFGQKSDAVAGARSVAEVVR